MFICWTCFSNYHIGHSRRTQNVSPCNLCILGPCEMFCYHVHIDHSVHVSLYHGSCFGHVKTCDTWSIAKGSEYIAQQIYSSIQLSPTEEVKASKKYGSKCSLEQIQYSYEPLIVLRTKIPTLWEERFSQISLSDSPSKYLDFITPFDVLRDRRWNLNCHITPFFLGMFVLCKYKLNKYVHTQICTYIHAYIHTYIHTCIHTYIHTYIHAYMRTYVNEWVIVFKTPQHERQIGY